MTPTREAEERSVVDFVTRSLKGDVEIGGVDAERKYFKVNNKGQKEVNIGGWILTPRTGSGDQFQVL